MPYVSTTRIVGVGHTVCIHNVWRLLEQINWLAGYKHKLHKFWLLTGLSFMLFLYFCAKLATHLTTSSNTN